MSRSAERLWRRSLIAATCGSLVIAAALLVSALLPVTPLSVSDIGHNDQTGATNQTLSDPKIEKLASVKMTRTIKEKSETVVKPPVPDLGTLIQVKGIFAFGDPKDTEAVIENLRTNQTDSYKAGNAVKGINASIVKIAKNVTFSYDGKEITMEIKSSDKAAYAPIATPGFGETMAATKQK
jgi:hypothetical protein